MHSVRCKLFAMHEGNWVERGTGPFKVNQTKKEGKHSARLGASLPPFSLRRSVLTFFATQSCAPTPLTACCSTRRCSASLSSTSATTSTFASRSSLAMDRRATCCGCVFPHSSTPDGAAEPARTDGQPSGGAEPGAGGPGQGGDAVDALGLLSLSAPFSQLLLGRLVIPYATSYALCLGFNV